MPRDSGCCVFLEVFQLEIKGFFTLVMSGKVFFCKIYFRRSLTSREKFCYWYPADITSLFCLESHESFLHDTVVFRMKE